MSEFKVIGKIVEIQDAESGMSKADKAWKKLNFILETDDQYDNTYSFELFGEKKVDDFIKYNKVGDSVDVKFNIRCSKWKDKYFTNLSAWSVFKAEGTEAPDEF